MSLVRPAILTMKSIYCQLAKLPLAENQSKLFDHEERARNCVEEVEQLAGRRRRNEHYLKIEIWSHLKEA